MAFFEKITPILVNKKSDDANITAYTTFLSIFFWSKYMPRKIMQGHAKTMQNYNKPRKTARNYAKLHKTMKNHAKLRRI